MCIRTIYQDLSYHLCAILNFHCSVLLNAINYTLHIVIIYCKNSTENLKMEAQLHTVNEDNEL